MFVVQFCILALTTVPIYSSYTIPDSNYGVGVKLSSVPTNTDGNKYNTQMLCKQILYGRGAVCIQEPVTWEAGRYSALLSTTVAVLTNLSTIMKTTKDQYAQSKH